MTALSTPDRAKLRELAEKATADEWTGLHFSDSQLRFVQAARPSVILALLDSLPSPVSVPEGDAREIATTFIVDNFGPGWLISGRVERLTAALLRGERKGLERAAEVADHRESSTEGNPPGNLERLAREIARDIRKLSLSSPEEG